jgi:hypothetical protein
MPAAWFYDKVIYQYFIIKPSRRHHFRHCQLIHRAEEFFAAIDGSGCHEALDPDRRAPAVHGTEAPAKGGNI